MHSRKPSYLPVTVTVVLLRILLRYNLPCSVAKETTLSLSDVDKILIKFPLKPVHWVWKLRQWLLASSRDLCSRKSRMQPVLYWCQFCPQSITLKKTIECKRTIEYCQKSPLINGLLVMPRKNYTRATLENGPQTTKSNKPVENVLKDY